jgi:hypothetical protein
MRKPLFILSTFSLFFAQAKEPIFPPMKHEDLPVHVDLNEPVYKRGIFETDKGGIIKGKHFRLQADKIQYIHKKIDGVLIHQVKAKGNILLQYEKRVFIGKALTFDLESKEGVLEEGTTLSCPWYVTSEKINIYPNKRYSAHNATLTACERKESSWNFFAKQICVDDCILETSGVRINLFQAISVPLPSLKINLAKSEERPLIRYGGKIDKGRFQGSFRYLAYSYQDLFIYLRGEYRLPKEFWKNPNWQRGFGGAIETDYLSKDKKSKFLTKSYVANDILIDDPTQKTRYRLQGEGYYKSDDCKTQAEWTWDKYSDRKMPLDFKTADFAVDSRKRSELYYSNQREKSTFFLHLQPRLNSFDSVNQKLPSATFRPYPIFFKKTTSDHFTKGGYLDYEFSDDIKGELKDFESGRVQTYHNFYKPITLDAFTFTPNIGGTGILYTDSPSNQAKGLGVFFTGLYAKADYHKYYTSAKHLIEPYLLLKYVATTSSPNSRYIFSIDDGISDLAQLKLGLKHFFLSRSSLHSFVLDLYADLFFDQDVLNTLPRGYLDLTWELPNLEFLIRSAWDFDHRSLFYYNMLARYTASEDFAFALEFRYRSKYRWRKSDQNSFFLDVTRSESNLLLSPLSDRRITILTNFFYRINHLLSLHVQSHHGFYRENQIPYNEFDVNLIASLSRHWKLTLSFIHQEGGNQWGFTFKLVK